MDAVDQQPAAPAPSRPWGVAGIDPHKRTFTVAVLNQRGGLHGVATFDTSDQGLAAALAWLDAVEFDLDRVGVEGSAWLGSQVATSLGAAGYDLREVQASRTAERRRRRRRAKTDAEDAQAIARETLAQDAVAGEHPVRLLVVDRRAAGVHLGAAIVRLALQVGAGGRRCSSGPRRPGSAQPRDDPLHGDLEAGRATVSASPARIGAIPTAWPGLPSRQG